MHALRSARHLTRLLLACFVFALYVAGAAPLARAPAMERICSGSGESRWVPSAVGEEGAARNTVHGWECALCLPVMLALPVLRWVPAHLPVAVAKLLPVQRQTLVLALSRAPFPPRAPPA